MSSDFSRIITLLRKEKGVTQRKAAEDLGVSQALLSHYEKGIRECGLDFVVRVADYYNVSCDYLLGRSADRSGLTLRVDEIPSPETAKDSIYHGSVLPTLNKYQPACIFCGSADDVASYAGRNICKACREAISALK